jgi:hypothetical protein
LSSIAFLSLLNVKKAVPDSNTVIAMIIIASSELTKDACSQANIVNAIRKKASIPAILMILRLRNVAFKLNLRFRVSQALHAPKPVNVYGYFLMQPIDIEPKRVIYER